MGAGVVVRRLPIPRVTGYYCRPAGRSPTRTRSAVDRRVTTEGHYPADGYPVRVDDQLSLRYVADDDVRDGDGDCGRVDDGDDGDEDEDEDDDDYDDSNNDNDDDDVHDDVEDMCGCATSTRRGLGTAAGKSARRAKSSCSVHRTPGVR